MENDWLHSTQKYILIGALLLILLVITFIVLILL